MKFPDLQEGLGLDEFSSDAVAAEIVGSAAAFDGLCVLLTGPQLLPYISKDAIAAQAKQVNENKYSPKAELSLRSAIARAGGDGIAPFGPEFDATDTYRQGLNLHPAGRGSREEHQVAIFGRRAEETLTSPPLP